MRRKFSFESGQALANLRALSALPVEALRKICDVSMDGDVL